MLQQEYTVLFNAITDAIQQLEMLMEQLKAAQQQAEDIYIERME